MLCNESARERYASHIYYIKNKKYVTRTEYVNTQETKY